MTTTDKRITDAWRQLDRRHFLQDATRSMADFDGPLPIGWGQTISQPTLVLEMTRILRPDPDSVVLEIGTGSGYQTALLAEVSGVVHTVERISALSESARIRLDELGYTNIHYHLGDGSMGWPESQPYDRIMVTAAAGRLPAALVEQLAPSGRMVIPVGPKYDQDLLLVEKDRKGVVRETSLMKVIFVELVGSCGWGED